MNLFMKQEGRWNTSKHKHDVLEKIADSYSSMCTSMKHETTSKPPVVQWYSRAALGLLGGAKNIREYYTNPEYKLASQLLPLQEFPGLLTLPGIHYDFALVLESSGFGCKVRWFDNQPPAVEPCINELTEIARLKMPDPQKDGLFPTAIEHYKYMLSHLDPMLIEAYPLLAGSVVILGPLEIAAAMLGATKFYISFSENPEAIHLLMDHITEGLIRWLSVLEEINSGHTVIAMVEHTPSYISPQHSEEFFKPYVKKIRDAYSDAIFLYHNEGTSNHYLHLIPQIGADVFHCQELDLAKAKKEIGNQVTLQGNLHPLNILRDGSEEEVIEASTKCFELASENGGFLLSSGGGLASPEGTTPRKNMLAMLKASERWSQLNF